MNENQQKEVPQNIQNADPFNYNEPGLPEQVMKFHQEQQKNQQIRRNIQMVKSPMQKFQAIPLCGLDIGVCDSLGQQFNQVCIKISYVLIPRSDANSFRLRNWDLWGPFFFLILYAFFVNNTDQLLLIIFSMLLGAYMVTYNVIALGGKVSFFQSFSILNYCIFPIYMGVFIQKLLFFFQVQNRIFTFSIMGASVIWTCLSVYVFIGVNAPESKKFLAVYPALLYYLYIGILLTFN